MGKNRFFVFRLQSFHIIVTTIGLLCNFFQTHKPISLQKRNITKINKNKPTDKSMKKEKQERERDAQTHFSPKMPYHPNEKKTKKKKKRENQMPFYSQRQSSQNPEKTKRKRWTHQFLSPLVRRKITETTFKCKNRVRQREREWYREHTPGRVRVYAILKVLELLHGKVGYVSH